MDAAPPRRVEHQGGRVVFREFRSQAADLAQSFGSYSVVGSNAQWRPARGIAGLHRSVEVGLRVEPAAGGPALGGVLVANAGRGHVADPWIGEWTQHFAKISGARRVIGVELTYNVIPLIAVVVREQGEITLYA